jgi:hypothetical protein
MQVDPSLLHAAEPGYEEPDLSGVDPTLIQLSQSMAMAQEERFTGMSEEFLLQKQYLNDLEEPEERQKSTGDVLADFVSPVDCSDVSALTAEESTFFVQIEANPEFKSKYQRADLAKSAVLAILEEEADQMRAIFGPKTSNKTKTASSKTSKFNFISGILQNPTKLILEHPHRSFRLPPLHPDVSNPHPPA